MYKNLWNWKNMWNDCFWMVGNIDCTRLWAPKERKKTQNESKIVLDFCSRSHSGWHHGDAETKQRMEMLGRQWSKVWCSWNFWTEFKEGGKYEEKKLQRFVQTPCKSVADNKVDFIKSGRKRYRKTLIKTEIPEVA